MASDTDDGRVSATRDAVLIFVYVHLQKNIFIACICYAGMAPFSLAQEPDGIGKQFAKHYASMKI